MNSIPFSAAADRNKQPILEVLRKVLPAKGSALEIASGTGQHVTWFGAGMPEWTWQPSDADPETLLAIAAWITQAGVTNVQPPVHIDVLEPQWPARGIRFTEPFDAVFCANMLHISPWSACAALMRGAARHLTPKGVLVTYGPYFEDDVPTAAGNLSFDLSLRIRDPSWGLRRVEEVAKQARLAGLRLHSRHQMPANNLLLVWGRGYSTPSNS